MEWKYIKYYSNNNFYFIEDIILNYLEIFEMDYYDVYKGLKKLNKELGDNYVYIIGNNMSYLQKIIDINEED